MGDQLVGCWAKLDRAREHLEALQTEIAAHAADPANLVIVRPELNAKGTHYDLVVDGVLEAPLVWWGVMVGDVVHNLRSALDHLAFQLVRAGPCSDMPDSKWNQVHFPIYDRREDFRDKLALRLPGVPLRQVALIEREQPYKRYHNVALSPLRRLRILSNADKHRVVTPLVFPTQEPMPMIEVREPHQLRSVSWFLYQPVIPGAVLAHIYVEPLIPQPEMNVNGHISAYVAFADASHASVYFGGMLGAVERILESFQSFFDSLP